MVFPIQILTGAAGALGAFGYILKKYLENVAEAEQTNEVEVFSWKLALATGLPVVAAGMAAGYALTPSTIADWVSIVFAGAGAAFASGKVVTFFRIQK